MTKEKAIEVMYQGKKVTHISFKDNEFIKLDTYSNMFETETGQLIHQGIFWNNHYGKEYHTGWHYVC